MNTGVTPFGASGIRRGAALVEVILVAVILVALYFTFRPFLMPARVTSKATICAQNLRGIGQALVNYAADNADLFPTHYFDTPMEDAAAPAAIRYVGMLGSTEALRITQETSHAVSPRAGHPSRSLFRLITAGNQTAGQFICPASGDEEDDCCNYGEDAGDAADSAKVAARPGLNRFDFRGYTCLSYGYQLPFGGGPPLGLRSDGRLPVLADKGPYFAAAAAPFRGTRSFPDVRSIVAPPTAEWIASGPSSKDWMPGNSRNHRGEGQNVWFVDGHVEFLNTPLAGIAGDNIYTAWGSEDEAARQAGRVAESPDDTLTAACASDSYLVP